ncbi:3-hydroxyisobutyrate dehydrogenase [Legionella spiritensis]|uniref:3-hydroxyisobutyrate dehydrogenase n=1 Tax=Legionella spiritensis TaxID=452 RepID=A0A0W0YZ86_LEGSP|nr:3-hydroxyisobutyrate dehydrogenase [Legionella spiritensis]KTD62229.1 3-hydroxyisobutyrate dehydrogenase [Legionella spiritensis]SNV29087.1 3-hydroxyisobutyrate dehydrogenase [Legionella spiritensis]
MAKIGFVGLGHMGLPMALNLIKAGHDVTGYDLQKNALETLVEAGGFAAQKLQDSARDQEIIFTMLQTGQQVQEVCLGDHGLYAAAHHALHIDCSSIDVPSAKQLHQQAAKRQLLSLDAPVSGGVSGATAATLTFMVGGKSYAFDKSRPYLEAMGKQIIHTGIEGSGQTAKICNNMILGITMIGVSEAFVLAKQLGLSPQKLFEIVNSSSGQCWVMSKYPPVPDLVPNVPANNDYKPGFTATMMLKDLILSQKCSLAAGVTTPLAEHATMVYQHFIDVGNGDLDFSAIIKFLEAEKGDS